MALTTHRLYGLTLTPMSLSLSGLISSCMNCLSSALAADPITAASDVQSCRFFTRVRIWDAIQYSLEKYPEKYHELVMIFGVIFNIFSVLILTAI